MSEEEALEALEKLREERKLIRRMHNSLRRSKPKKKSSESVPEGKPKKSRNKYSLIPLNSTEALKEGEGGSSA
ncbi:hypothetical protein CMI37_04495 [Candidatus Pacearchaeota archaeon]|nr:hypothetical protein [Candidatus Pacearchaeota archaeon]|tara:strand:- start:358 stop:576 length:219 start_codon:yes stop_codon:yes gene_type:complete